MHTVAEACRARLYTVSCLQVHAKILSASWSNDGQHLAIGFIDGRIMIRDRDG
jgi:hypothetical protein